MMNFTSLIHVHTVTPEDDLFLLTPNIGFNYVAYNIWWPFTLRKRLLELLNTGIKTAVEPSGSLHGCLATQQTFLSVEPPSLDLMSKMLFQGFNWLVHRSNDPTEFIQTQVFYDVQGMVVSFDHILPSLRQVFDDHDREKVQLLSRMTDRQRWVPVLCSYLQNQTTPSQRDRAVGDAIRRSRAVPTIGLVGPDNHFT